MHRFLLATVMVFGLLTAPGISGEENTATLDKPVAEPKEPDVIYVPTPDEVVDQDAQHGGCQEDRLSL